MRPDRISRKISSVALKRSSGEAEWEGKISPAGVIWLRSWLDMGVVGWLVGWLADWSVDRSVGLEVGKGGGWGGKASGVSRVIVMAKGGREDGPRT